MSIILSRIMIVTCGLQAVLAIATFAAAKTWAHEFNINLRAIRRMWREGIE